MRLYQKVDVAYIDTKILIIKYFTDINQSKI